MLLRAAAEAGLDRNRAREIIESGEFVGEVHARVERWRALGIDSVPSTVVDDRHLIQGAQSIEVFERALREIAAVPALR